MRFMLIISFGKTTIFPKLIISRVKIIKFSFKNFFFFIMRNLFQSEVNFTMEILKLMTEIFDGNIYLKLNSKIIFEKYCSFCV
ncbi:hypothetical protein EFO00_05320 [Lactococcus cremoris]|uniref:Uncharacterized protein n=1 Tax=Lactococcus lactis TaxID=1358 RepID=Q2VHP9_9LACT|nr:hypothetical protein pSK11L_20 [Lactococcus lactis]MCT4408671.1 hypothetical protein [Lactococcus cremoris]